MLLLLGATLIALATGPIPVPAQPAGTQRASPAQRPPQQDALLPYLVQSACVDGAGAAIAGMLPFEPGCIRRRPLSQADAASLPYRRHDWPTSAHARQLPQGYQASDALLGTLLGRPAILHTLDFGNAPRRFTRFDAGQGDGGQALILHRSGEAAAAMTEDGAGGVQWFASPTCRAGDGSGDTVAPLPDGWLFAAAPLREVWTVRQVHLSITRRPEDCPAGFGVSHTRWRRIPRLVLPWREAATGQVGTLTTDAVLSEHFGGDSIPRADHLERFYFARDLGMVRWERWENGALSQLPDREAMARLIAGSRRCPQPVAFSEPPAPNWMMVDCRTWTNFVRAAPGTPLAAMGWPAPPLR